MFVKRHEHSILFDQAFKIFFRKRGYLEKLIAAMLPETAPTEPKPPPPGAQRIQEALFSGVKEKEQQTELEIDMRLTVSDRDILQRKDFAQMSAAEIAAAKAAMCEARCCRCIWCARGASRRTAAATSSTSAAPCAPA